MHVSQMCHAQHISDRSSCWNGEGCLPAPVPLSLATPPNSLLFRMSIAPHVIPPPLMTPPVASLLRTSREQKMCYASGFQYCVPAEKLIRGDMPSSLQYCVPAKKLKEVLCPLLYSTAHLLRNKMCFALHKEERLLPTYICYISSRC